MPKQTKEYRNYSHKIAAKNMIVVEKTMTWNAGDTSRYLQVLVCGTREEDSQIEDTN